MAKKKNADQDAADNVLVDAAKTIGTAAGKVAAALGATPPQVSQKIPKLAKKNKARLPRRQKKAQKKAASKQ